MVLYPLCYTAQDKQVNNERVLEQQYLFETPTRIQWFYSKTPL